MFVGERLLRCARRLTVGLTFCYLQERGIRKQIVVADNVFENRTISELNLCVVGFVRSLLEGSVPLCRSGEAVTGR